MPEYEAILFDCDGVLVDTEPVHFECWRETLAPFGIHLGWDVYERSCIGIADRDMLQMLCNLADPPLDLERLWAEYPNKRSRFRERIRQVDPVTPEVREFLGTLGGYRLAVVSSSGRAEVEPLLGCVLHHFQALVCREDVANAKPAPDPYLKAAELLGVSFALVVEDSEAGLASGRAAGFDVVAVPKASQMPELVWRALGGCR